jgi:hypothetical protein
MGMERFWNEEKRKKIEREKMRLKRKRQWEKMVPSIQFGERQDVLLLALLVKVNSSWAEMSPSQKLLLHRGFKN